MEVYLPYPLYKADSVEPENQDLVIVHMTEDEARDLVDALTNILGERNKRTNAAYTLWHALGKLNLDRL